MSPRSQLTKQSVRVLTLNLWGLQGAWSDRRSVLIGGLRALQPDLVAFQEAVKTDDYDQATDLLTAEYHVIHQGGRSPDGLGTSIACRRPLEELKEVSFHVTPRIDRLHGWIGSAAATEVRFPDPIGRLLFVHHKPSWQWGFETERELQAVAAARFVEDVVGQRRLHVVLAGDFDAPPDSASIRFWRGRQSLSDISVCYVDAWEKAGGGGPGHTFSPRNPLVSSGDMPLEQGRRIDYIFVRCGDHGPTLEVSACALVFDEPSDRGVWASDHFGVVADLTAE